MLGIAQGYLFFNSQLYPWAIIYMCVMSVLIYMPLTCPRECRHILPPAHLVTPPELHKDPPTVNSQEQLILPPTTTTTWCYTDPPFIFAFSYVSSSQSPSVVTPSLRPNKLPPGVVRMPSTKCSYILMSSFNLHGNPVQQILLVPF